MSFLRPLQKRVESRKRGLQFYMPAIVAIGQHCRLVESNSSIISLQDIYERHCTEAGMDKDDPIMAYTEKLKDIISVSRHVSSARVARDMPLTNDVLQQPGFVTAAAKLEAYMEIASKIFPDTIVRDVSTSKHSSIVIAHLPSFHSTSSGQPHLRATCGILGSNSLFTCRRSCSRHTSSVSADGHLQACSLIVQVARCSPRIWYLGMRLENRNSRIRNQFPSDSHQIYKISSPQLA